ncbi:RNA-binding S4 domain-containing protein [Cellvibrio japonicus]|nr:S4 domain-containing protein [Cellvibrio japonicus]QEI11031.1 RNA-binding protein [Cellvibrio japonicus]QEI14606.1 RNA-binding protein [Cellvibrio japonicus]QEI18185.1 RNA-binding protein [Cellvibrio japonicus]
MSKQKHTLEDDADDDKIRIDKWLWAARFFKTRSLAKQAIDGGKIHCDGQRIKASKEVTIGLVLNIRQDWDEKTVVVKALSDQRRGAPEAALLYAETEASVALREKRRLERKAGLGAFIVSDHRPNKKERRQIHRFQRINLLDNED